MEKENPAGEAGGLSSGRVDYSSISLSGLRRSSGELLSLAGLARDEVFGCPLQHVCDEPAGFRRRLRYRSYRSGSCHGIVNWLWKATLFDTPPQGSR